MRKRTVGGVLDLEKNAVETAAKTDRDLRIAEVVREDVTIESCTIKVHRVRLGISFKYESDE